MGSANTLKRSAIMCRAASESSFFARAIVGFLTGILYIANWQYSYNRQLLRSSYGTLHPPRFAHWRDVDWLERLDAAALRRQDRRRQRHRSRYAQLGEARDSLADRF